MSSQPDPRKEIAQLSPFSTFIKKTAEKKIANDKVFSRSIQEKIIKETKVEVNLPSSIQVDLVQGNELRHYEIFFSVSSFSLSTAVGFWTGYINDVTRSSALFWSAFAFTGFALIGGATALFYRSKLRNGTVKKTMTLNKFN